MCYGRVNRNLNWILTPLCVQCSQCLLSVDDILIVYLVSMQQWQCRCQIMHGYNGVYGSFRDCHSFFSFQTLAWMLLNVFFAHLFSSLPDLPVVSRLCFKCGLLLVNINLFIILLCCSMIGIFYWTDWHDLSCFTLSATVWLFCWICLNIT